MVFYRKYRPQTIHELDSQDVREKLFAILSAESLPHAFFFTGPKGLGKTSTARIVAKVVNCEKNKTRDKKPEKGKKTVSSASIEPCDKCNQCLSIISGTNIDVIEIDGASNRGIDEIRDLREKARLAAACASKKVYIIDEVHMLTTEAFNALLKMLEEPPSHVLFILCTTESHKVPATILSRCFNIVFTMATHEDLQRSFLRIVEGESISIDKEALFAIARLSDGSFRDGAKILEEISVFAKDQKITKAIVEEKYHIISTDYFIQELITAFERKDLKQGINTTQKLISSGIDMKFFLEELINTIHLMLLVAVGIESSQPVKKSTLGPDELKEILILLIKAVKELKYAILPQLPLEIVLISWCGKVQQQELKKEMLTPFAKTLPLPDNEWIRFLDIVKTRNFSLAGLLRGSVLKSVTKDMVTLETNFTFHKDKLEQAKDILGKSWQEMTGNSVQIKVLLKEKS